MGPRHAEQTPSFNPKCALTVGSNRTSHLLTTKELEACMDVSCEASFRWPADWADALTIVKVKAPIQDQLSEQNTPLTLSVLPLVTYRKLKSGLKGGSMQELTD
ncbi:unnamed protein product [Pleuronectes platessa]|uniref:Uncharacterized protein n=1 Tax=Pleuronectes platessa TaxID=8262 RepID=A0A9N7YPI7_PLEPL|nr:unnamed protein product [Pleuronectes platessa]